MKTTMVFDSNNEEDSYSLKRAQKSLDMYLALWDLSMRFRAINKHDVGPVTPDEFYTILNKYDLNLMELGN